MVDNIVKMLYYESWKVIVERKLSKRIKKLPKNVQVLFQTLVVDLAAKGPIQFEWPNYSRLTQGRFHCHLNYKYVAVWLEENRELKIIEVIYVGSRENAPY